MMRDHVSSGRPKPIGQLIAESPSETTPHSIDIEQALLGAILVNNAALDRVSNLVEARHFYEPLHHRIFSLVDSEVARGRVATPVTLQPYFQPEERVGQISVAEYLARLAAASTSVQNAEYYGKALVELWMRRQLVEIGGNMQFSAYDPECALDAAAQIERSEHSLYALADGQTGEVKHVTAYAAGEAALSMIAAAYQRDGGLSGLSTGFRDLDSYLGGLAPSDLIILAGRPSMGKSALASNVAFNVAEMLEDGTMPSQEDQHGEVSLYSLEMSAEQIFMREIARHSGISSERMRRGTITEDEYIGRVEPSTRALQRLKLHIDPTGGLTISQLAARARRRKRLADTRLIVLDYLQLMSSGTNYGNRATEVAEITTGLKALAKELGVPIIALSQLSRQVENRENKRPQLSDLRESGAIEQDADIVMFVYREEYYLERQEPPPQKVEEHLVWEASMDAARGKGEVIIGKQRHGPIGTVIMGFNGATTAFSDLAQR